MAKKTFITDTERQVIRLLRQHGEARRVFRSNQQSDYSWWIGERAVTGTIFRLAPKGLVEVDNDNDVARLTAKGRQIAREIAA